MAVAAVPVCVPADRHCPCGTAYVGKGPLPGTGHILGGPATPQGQPWNAWSGPFPQSAGTNLPVSCCFSSTLRPGSDPRRKCLVLLA
ncbi:hypothetical protein STTU_2577 [Streptomyces sp. Tu6071]|nr:hypothetical protein STTU_2577 [Streptomyces sp. Tu6071]